MAHVRATLTMKVLEGREDDFEAAWRTGAEATSAAPGNLSQTLLRAGDAERTFLICSEWTSREAFGAYETSPEQDDLTAPIRALRESASMRVDELVVHVVARNVAE